MSLMPIYSPVATPYVTVYSGDFNGSDGYLSKVMGAGGNLTVWTMSAFIKPDTVGVRRAVGGAGDDNTNFNYLEFEASNILSVQGEGTGPAMSKRSSATFTDTTNWQHVLVSRNGTDVDVYYNGSEVTSWTTDTDPGSANGEITSAVLHVWGVESHAVVSQYWPGLMCELALIDGQALTPSSFATDNLPIDLSGLTFGTVGHWIKDPSTGVDSSGNGLDFTKSGTIAQSTDVPT